MIRTTILMIFICIIVNLKAICQNVSEERIFELFEAQSMDNSLRILVDSLIEDQKEVTGEIPNYIYPDFWEIFRHELTKDSLSFIKKAVVPIYQEILNEKEIDALISFYRSDVGKSILSKYEEIDAKVAISARIAGERLGSEIIKRIEVEKTELMNEVFYDCLAVKTGVFSERMNDNEYVHMTRTEDLQISDFNGAITKYRIRWINECQYELYLFETNNDLMKSLLNKSLLANIYEVGEDYYKYIMSVEDSDLKVFGKVNVIDE